MRRLIVTAAVLAAAGCGGEPPPTGPGPPQPVSGKILYDGKPAAGVQVIFMSTVGALPGGGTPAGTTGPDGTFTLTTFAPDDGAPAGSYRVVLRWPPAAKAGEGEGAEAENTDRLLGWYEAGHTSLSVTVKPGANDLPPFRLPVRTTPPGATPGIPGMN